MSRVGQATERGLDVVPASFILEAALDQLRDKGAPPPRSRALVELGNQCVVQCYVYAHGLKLAHKKAHFHADVAAFREWILEEARAGGNRGGVDDDASMLPFAIS